MSSLSENNYDLYSENKKLVRYFSDKKFKIVKHRYYPEIFSTWKMVKSQDKRFIFNTYELINSVYEFFGCCAFKTYKEAFKWCLKLKGETK